MSQQKLGYIVVFEHTAAAGLYQGVRTWSSVGSKADFEAYFAAQDGKIEDGKKVIGTELVIAEGVSSEQAIQLTKETPMRSYLLAAIHDATDPVTGEVNMEIARHKLEGVFFLHSHRRAA